MHSLPCVHHPQCAPLDHKAVATAQRLDERPLKRKQRQARYKGALPCQLGRTDHPLVVPTAGVSAGTDEHRGAVKPQSQHGRLEQRTGRCQPSRGRTVHQCHHPQRMDQRLRAIRCTRQKGAQPRWYDRPVLRPLQRVLRLQTGALGHQRRVVTVICPHKRCHAARGIAKPGAKLANGILLGPARIVQDRIEPLGSVQNGRIQRREDVRARSPSHPRHDRLRHRNLQPSPLQRGNDAADLIDLRHLPAQQLTQTASQFQRFPIAVGG